LLHHRVLSSTPNRNEGELKVTVKRQAPVVRERWEMFLGHVATYVLCTSSPDTNRRTAKAATQSRLPGPAE
jgi:hypothetical protein